MKKILVSVLAIAGLVACNNENVISVADSRTPITFDGVFVENATRANDPSTTTDNINEFYVWAYMNEVDGTVFEDEKVSRSGAKWTYDHISYWMPDNHYFFAAFAGDRSNDQVVGLPVNMEKYGLGEITFTNNDGTNDILYAEYDVVANATNAPVKFQFAHLLSKVKFTFINGFANENQTVVVKDIQMVAPEVASVNLSEVVLDPDHRENNKIVWDNYSEDVTLDFGDMNGAAKLAIGDRKSSDNERLTIPASAKQSYTITFLVDVYNGNQPGIKDRLMTVELKGFEFVAGRAYNLVATINQENLNLDAIEFEVVVDEWIDQEVDGGAVEGEVTFVTEAAEIQKILDNATEDVTILFGNDIDGDVTILQKKGVDVTINGNGYKYDGVFTVNGDARAAGAETLTFTGINFEFANPVDATFISAPSKINNRYNYAHNITIENCTFTGAYDQGVEVGSASFTGAYNIVMKNCEAYKMHSLLQTQSVDNTVLVENVKVIGGKNGLSFGNTAYPTLRNAEIEAEFYGVRADGNASRGNLVIEDSKITANQPVVVRKVTTDGYAVNIDEASVITRTGDYDVIFTKDNDDDAYVAPAKAFTFNGPADLVVFPQTVVVHNAEEIAAALKAETQKINVKLANDIEVAISTIGTTAAGDAKQMGGANTEAITIDLNGNKLNLTTTYWSVLGAKNSDAIVTIKNGTMTSSQATGTWNSYDLSFSNCNYAFEDVVFEKAIALEAANKSYNLKNVTINETHDYYAMWITAEGQNVTIDGLTVNSLGRGIKIDEQYVGAPAKVTLNIADATFKTANKAAILVKSVAGAEINVENINIAEVAADADFAVWVDEDAAAYADLVVVNGALVKVEGSADTVVTTAAELTSAVKDAKTGDKVYVTEGTYNSFPAVGNKNITLVCNDVVFEGNSKLNIGGSTVIGATFSNPSGNAVDQTINGIFKNCTFTGSNALRYSYVGETCVFENCIFDGSVYGIHFDGGNAKEVTFRNCTISGFNGLAAAIGMVTFEGCTFVGNGKSGYNGANLWGSAKMINCEFTFNGTTANEWIDCIGADKTYEFVDCTINGVAYTADNYTEYDEIFSRNHTTVKINGVDCAM